MCVNVDVYLHVVHMHPPHVHALSPAKRFRTNSTSSWTNQGLVFFLPGHICRIRSLTEKPLREALQNSGVCTSACLARSKISLPQRSMTSEGKTSRYDRSRRGGAAAEVVLTCGRLAEREQRHTVTCWWINTQTFVWGHCFSKYLSLSLFLEMCCLTPRFPPEIIFLPCPLFLSLSRFFFFLL